MKKNIICGLIGGLIVLVSILLINISAEINWGDDRGLGLPIVYDMRAEYMKVEYNHKEDDKNSKTFTFWQSDKMEKQSKEKGLMMSKPKSHCEVLIDGQWTQYSLIQDNPPLWDDAIKLATLPSPVKIRANGVEQYCR